MRLISTERMAALAARLRIAATRFTRDADGATMIEYSLLTAVMAGAVITCMLLFGNAMKGMFDSIIKYYTLAQ
ncbi:Flp family type IVb pilin [Methylorubrum sp. SB2]|uniref:Flp family type IVb pilin n=1 Tax=Methylorubrum subtropicum TaxID=3138812 RepID=UPI00313AF51A